MIKEGINKQKMTFREGLGHIWGYGHDTLKLKTKNLFIISGFADILTAERIY